MADELRRRAVPVQEDDPVGFAYDHLSRFFKDHDFSKIEAELRPLTPEERNRKIREKITSMAEAHRDEMISASIEGTIGAAQKIFAERLDLCSVCGEKHGPQCFLHLEDQLAMQRAKRFHDRHWFFAPMELSLLVATLLSSRNPHVAGRYDGFSSEEIGMAFRDADEIVRTSIEVKSHLERDLNAEEPA